MREANKSEAFKFVRALNSDGDHSGESDAPLDDEMLDRYWRVYRCGELPEPLDAIWLQCVMAVPDAAAVRLLQSAAYITPATGVLDDAMMEAVLKMRSAGVEELLLHEQSGFYVGRDADRALCGIGLQADMRRIERCNEFLADWTTAHRNNVPLRAL